MILKVDPDELYDVTKVMKKDVDVFNSEIDNMNDTLEKLKSIWQGVDATAFIENFTNFLTRLKGIPTTLETLYKVCDKTNEMYVTKDQEFAKELKDNLNKEELTKTEESYE